MCQGVALHVTISKTVSAFCTKIDFHTLFFYLVKKSSAHHLFCGSNTICFYKTVVEELSCRSCFITTIKQQHKTD